MKYIITLTLCSFYFLSSFGQQKANSRAALLKQHNQVIGLLLNAQKKNNLAEKTTHGVPSERVVAQCTHDSMANLVDSVSLGYMFANRESNYDYNQMFYPYNYQYNKSPMFNFGGLFTKPQVLFDTCFHYTLSPYTLVYGLFDITYATYDAYKCQKTFKDIFTDSTTNQNVTYADSFNAAHNISIGYWFNESAGIADSSFKQYFAYNTLNKITADSIYEKHGSNWYIVGRTYYSYDGPGNLIKIDGYANTMDTTFPATFPEQVQYTNTYDASGRLLTVFTKYFDGTALSQYANDSFGYTGTHTFHTSWKEYEYDDINGYWTPFLNMTKQLNPAGFPDTITTQSWDSLSNAWVPLGLYVTSYNSQNAPDTLQEYDYNFTYYPSTPSYTTVYYYDSFADNTSVPLAARGSGSFLIYPNPSKASVNITTLSPLADNNVIVVIADMQGKVVSRVHTTLMNNTAAIATNNLATGVYCILIGDTAGKLLYRQTIEKCD